MKIFKNINYILKNKLLIVISKIKKIYVNIYTYKYFIVYIIFGIFVLFLFVYFSYLVWLSVFNDVGLIGLLSVLGVLFVPLLYLYLVFISKNKIVFYLYFRKYCEKLKHINETYKFIIYIFIVIFLIIIINNVTPSSSSNGINKINELYNLNLDLLKSAYLNININNLKDIDLSNCVIFFSLKNINIKNIKNKTKKFVKNLTKTILKIKINLKYYLNSYIIYLNIMKINKFIFKSLLIFQIGSVPIYLSVLPISVFSLEISLSNIDYQGMYTLDYKTNFKDNYIENINYLKYLVDYVNKMSNNFITINTNNYYENVFKLYQNLLTNREFIKEILPKITTEGSTHYQYNILDALIHKHSYLINNLNNEYKALINNLTQYDLKQLQMDHYFSLKDTLERRYYYDVINNNEIFTSFILLNKEIQIKFKNIISKFKKFILKKILLIQVDKVKKILKSCVILIIFLFIILFIIYIFMVKTIQLDAPKTIVKYYSNIENKDIEEIKKDFYIFKKYLPTNTSYIHLKTISELYEEWQVLKLNHMKNKFWEFKSLLDKNPIKAMDILWEYKNKIKFDILNNNEIIKDPEILKLVHIIAGEKGINYDLSEKNYLLENKLLFLKTHFLKQYNESKKNFTLEDNAYTNCFLEFQSRYKIWNDFNFIPSTYEGDILIYLSNNFNVLFILFILFVLFVLFILFGKNIIEKIKNKMKKYNTKLIKTIEFYNINIKKIFSIIKIIFISLVKILITYVSIILYLIFTIFILKFIYFYQIQLENIFLSVNFPMSFFKFKNLIPYPKTGCREEEVANALKNYNEVEWAKFIFKNKYFDYWGIDVDNLTDEQIILVAKIKKFVQDKDYVVNIETDKNLNNNKHLLNNSEENNLDIEIKNKKPRLEENKTNCDNESLDINVEDLDFLNYFMKKNQNLESSSFLFDITKRVKNFINKKVENTLDVNLEDKLKQYYDWSITNIKENLGFNFTNEVTEDLNKIKNGNEIVDFSNIKTNNSSIDDLSLYLKNYLSNNIFLSNSNLNDPSTTNSFVQINNNITQQTVWFDTETDSGYGSSTFSIEIPSILEVEYIEFIVFIYFLILFSILIISVIFFKDRINFLFFYLNLKWKNLFRSPFFYSNKIWNKLSNINKIKIFFHKYKNRIYKTTKTFISMIVLRYLIRCFIILITPFLNLFLFDMSFLFSASFFNIYEDSNFNEDSKLTRRKLSPEERAWRKQNREWKKIKNMVEDLPQIPADERFRRNDWNENPNSKYDNRESLGNQESFTLSKAYTKEQLRTREIYENKFTQSIVEEEFTKQKDKELNKILIKNKNNKEFNFNIFKNIIDLKDSIKDKFSSFFNLFKKNKINPEEEEELLEEIFWSNRGDYKSEWIEFNDLRSKRKIEKVIPNETVKLDKENPLNKYNFRGVINSEPSIPLQERIIKKQDFIKNYKKSGWID